MAKLNIQSVDVLIHGNNRNLVNLQKTALNAFQFKKINWTRRPADLHEVVNTTMNDIIILNDDSSIKLEDAMTMLRGDATNCNPYAIVIVVTPSPSRKYLCHALRIGADGVIGLPFSATDLWRQLAFFVNNQRTFLRTNSYFGPDRRRMKGINYGGEERRVGEEFDQDFQTQNKARV